jgi:hypothetical protein
LVGAASPGFYTTVLVGLVLVMPPLYWGTVKPGRQLERLPLVLSATMAVGLLLVILFMVGVSEINRAVLLGVRLS